MDEKAIYIDDELIVRRNGIVAFFDILGYESLLRKNEPEIAAKIVIRTFKKIPKIIPEKILDAIPNPEAKQLALNVLADMKWNIFSDTIFSSIPVDTYFDHVINIRKVMVFLASCIFLQRDLFDAGLPIRGALSMGHFILSDNCFVGPPVIEAYKLCVAQNWSGVAICPETGDELLRLINHTSAIRTILGVQYFLTKYPVPFNDKTKKNLLCLRWGDASNLVEPYWGDFREYVESKFSDHRKDVDEKVKPKMENTISFLQFCRNCPASDLNALTIEKQLTDKFPEL